MMRKFFTLLTSFGYLHHLSEKDVRVQAADRTASSYFRYGANNIPHHSKRYKGGEDAWVASSNILVVADGVGGWAEEGIDSGLFSKQLVHNIKKIFDKDESQNLKDVLVEAV